MILNLDSIIFISFLVINLIVGLFYSRGVKNTREYAVGDRKFSTIAITVTIVATCVGGGLFSTALAESYREGLYFIVPVILGDLISLSITGYILIPRMIEFFGNLSVAEAMGKIYGRYARIIIAISGIFLSTGIVALQFKVASSVMQLFFGIGGFYTVLITAIIVIIYSSFGGIKAVTFTDILQFAVFGVVIPLICVTIWYDTPLNITQIFDKLSNNSLFDYQKVFSFDNPRLMSLGFLVLVFIIPALDPAFFQRISMAKGVTQAQRSFVSAALIIASITTLICWTAVLLLSNSPDLNPDNLLPYVIDKYTYTGLKGLAAVGIIATIMSTADSYINSATVMLEYDIIQVLFRKPVNFLSEVLLLRLTAVFVGVVALYISYDTGTMQQIFLKMLSFYMPVVSVPLLFAVFGFRSSSKVALIGMGAGALTVIIWSCLYGSDDSVIPAMAANAACFIIGYNLFKSKNSSNLNHNVQQTNSHQENKKKFQNFFIKMRNFSFINLCRKNLPKNNSTFFIIGLVSIINVLTTLHFTAHEIQNYHFLSYQFIYQSSLVCSFMILLYPLMADSFKQTKVMSLFFLMGTSYILIFTPMILIVMSQFNQIQTVIFLINFLAYSYLMQWQITLSSLALSSVLSIKFYHEYFIKYENDLNFLNQGLTLDAGITYIVLISSIVLIFFIKPRQEAQEIYEEKVDHLTGTIKDQDDQILELSNLKQTFLRNLQHETNTPITGIYSMSQALHDCYDKLTDEQRKKSINTIVTSSERLISYANNLIDISKLSSQTYHLKLYKVNLSRLLDEVIRKCKKLYINAQDEENIEINISIEPNISTSCDEYYMRRIFENLIINAIQYCKKGKIEVILKKIKNDVQFIIKDSGIGIPKEELLTIFEPFVTSSRTTTPAGGRGVGLSVAKAAAEAHDASLVAGSNGKKGSVFTLTMPIRA